MKHWRNLVPAAGLLLALAVSASAREWTDNTGTYKTEADLVEVRGNQVVLKKSNGQVISLPIDRLSKSDQEYLESLENLEPKPENAAPPATETVTNSIRMKLKLIPPGEFVMGSPEAEEKRGDRETQHRVQITRSFYMGVTEVTQRQWLSVMRSRPWRDKTSLEAQHLRVTLREGGNYPALNLSWEDAVFFCNQLSKKEKLSPCYEIKALASAAPGDRQTIGVEFLPQGTGYRLPTEAEWEYACRAGTTTAYSFGDDKSKLELYAWYDANSKNKIPSEHQVGTKLPNPWGLHDMHGSVYEWCQDWGGDYDPADVTDPTGPAQGTVRVFRGGCAGAADSCCRSAFRLGMYPTNRQYSFGMRVVRVADPQLAEQEPPKPIAKEPPIPPLPPPVANDAPKPARDFKPDREVTFQIYGLGHARQMLGQVYGKPIWANAPCLDCIKEIIGFTPFHGTLNKVKGLDIHEYEVQADPRPLTCTAEIDAENTDLGEVGKAVLQANTPHRTAKQLYLELPARLNPNSAQTALRAIDKLKGVVQGGSKAVARSADARSEKILVRISGLESLTLADILAALKAAGIEVTLP